MLFGTLNTRERCDAKKVSKPQSEAAIMCLRSITMRFELKRTNSRKDILTIPKAVDRAPKEMILLSLVFEDGIIIEEEGRVCSELRERQPLLFKDTVVVLLGRRGREKEKEEGEQESVGKGGKERNL